MIHGDMGGPLSDGRLAEIEDLDSRPCVTCPWHHYQIMLDTGEGIYKALDHKMHSKGEYEVYQFACGDLTFVVCAGVRQRVHRVKVEGGKVFVALNLGGKELPSDVYQNLEGDNHPSQPRSGFLK